MCQGREYPKKRTKKCSRERRRVRVKLTCLLPECAAEFDFEDRFIWFDEPCYDFDPDFDF